MRLFWRANLADNQLNYVEGEDIDPVRWHNLIHQERIAAVPEDANLVGSECADGLHMPAIDLDIPCHLKESSTPGHYHLFIDQKVTWVHYQEILRTMCDAGLVERGFYELSVARGATFLRTHPKGERDHMEYPSETGESERPAYESALDRLIAQGLEIARRNGNTVAPGTVTNPQLPVDALFDYVTDNLPEDGEMPF